MRFVVISVAALIFTSGCSKTPPCEDKYSAFTMANKFIKAKLRSPSSADFPVVNAKGVSARPEILSNGQCAFTITTYVDAQNGFGATIRQNFSVTVAPDAYGREYKLIEIFSY